MAAAAVPNGHPSAAGDGNPPPPQPSSSSSSSSLVFLGTGCSSAVPNARCLIQPSDPPCAVCSQSLTVPPELNPNYRCNTSLLIDYCQDEGAHKYIIIDVGKTFREQVLRWFVCHKIPCVDSYETSMLPEDVYSFGVVLLELMTRKRALYADSSSKEKRSLSHSFLLMFHQNMHLKMLDSEITEDATAMVVVEKLAALAVHCLSARGDDSPTMKEVAERLQVLCRIQMHQAGDGDNDGDFCGGSPWPVVLPSGEVTDGSLET